MGLFGIKKANEDNKPNNTFINQSVINAEDYSNMPNNTIVGYNDPTQTVASVPDNNMVNNVATPETFVYTQVDASNYNNQFVNNIPQVEDVQPQVMYDNNIQQVQPVQDVFVQPMSNEVQPVQPVVMTVDSTTYTPVEQTVNVQEAVPFDNSALFALPAGAVQQQVEEQIQEVEELDTSDIEISPVVEEVPQYDPLNNANNPIPVNPVADEPAVDETLLFEEEVEVKTNLFTVMNMMVGIIIKPATTITENAKKYTKIFNSLLLYFWIAMFSFVFCLVGRLIAGSFSTTKDAISGASKILLDFSGLVSTDNYVPYLLITVLIAVVGILVVALVYYLSSFINSKGVHMGVYFALSALSMVPLILGFTILHPIVSILSNSLALLVLIFSIIYSLIILFTGVNSLVKFKTMDGVVVYNAINIAIILSIMVFIFSTLSSLNILELSFVLG